MNTNSRTRHPGKTEYMLIGSKTFVTPLRGIILGKHYIYILKEFTLQDV